MFDNSSYKDWIQQVQKYIKDQPLESYYHEVSNGIEYQPFAHEKNTTERGVLDDETISHHIGVWFNVSSNKNILEALMNGAQSVDLELNNNLDIDAVLKDVKLNYIKPIFRSKHEGLEEYLNDHYEPNSIDKAIFDYKTNALKSVKQLFTLYPRSTKSEIDELVDIAQSYLNTPIEFPAFTVQLGEKFFLEIARLRALRIVIANLKKQKGVIGPHIEIITRMAPAVLEGDPDNALIAQTSIAMASIIGGATVTQLDSYGESKHQRLSLNIQNILLLESHLSEHKDPMGGSYFIEDLTDKIATKVWNQLSF